MTYKDGNDNEDNAAGKDIDEHGERLLAVAKIIESIQKSFEISGRNSVLKAR